ncbi:MAG: ComF family protein [Acidimicrobiales bacterium]|nr:ComF family protein [Acidimicrobiales bacterium]
MAAVAQMAGPGELAPCPVCGQTRAGGSCPNRWCRRADRGFSVVFSVGTHRGALRQAIARYKYQGEGHLGAVFAGMISNFVQREAGWFEEFDVMAAVPTFRGSSARRGWDPMGELLARLAERLPGWAVEPGLLAKRVETPAMAGRSWADRQAIARHELRRSLFVPDPARVRGAQVLVLDDVFTEGSTLREVAGVLRRAGASDVAGLVLARPGWAPTPPEGRPDG